MQASNCATLSEPLGLKGFEERHGQMIAETSPKEHEQNQILQIALLLGGVLTCAIEGAMGTLAKTENCD